MIFVDLYFAPSPLILCLSPSQLSFLCTEPHFTSLASLILFDPRPHTLTSHLNHIYLTTETSHSQLLVLHPTSLSLTA